jgi:hypothetical protein
MSYIEKIRNNVVAITETKKLAKAKKVSYTVAKIMYHNGKKDIEQERINESRRIKDYDDAESIRDKQNIEQKNKKERKEFGKRINDLNDNIEKYVDDYRKKLVREQGYS